MTRKAARSEKTPPPISIEELRARISYDPETGVLTWLHSSLALPAKNTINAGKPAFRQRCWGYHVGSLMGVQLRAHRVAWALHYGAWPDGFIDHINGVRDDNRIANLRCVTKAENCRNAAKRSDNTSGQTGVTWNARKAAWMARAVVDGHDYFLGNFKELDAAIRARKDAEIDLGFHPNHGRAA